MTFRFISLVIMKKAVFKTFFTVILVTIIPLVIIFIIKEQTKMLQTTKKIYKVF